MWLGLLIACGGTTATIAPVPDDTTPEAVVDTPIEDTPEDTPQADPPGPAPVADGALVLNEVQPANDSTVMDAAGAFPDWFELYNGTPDPIDLSRVTVAATDGVWRGAGTLAGHAHLRVFAQADATSADVAPFSLTREGGGLALRLDDVVTDEVIWGVFPRDASFARFPDGREWATTGLPTPGWTNGARATDSPDPSDLLFRTDRASELRIWLPDSSRTALNADPYGEVPAAIAFEGAFFPHVGIHIKGRYGSLRTLDGKAAFKIDLNEYEDHRLRGLEALTINNMVQDPTYTHEALTYELYRAMGVPAPRTGYVWVYVDDELFGLYLNLETVDDTFLQRWFGDGSGPMWEGSYGTDLEPDSVEAFEYEEGPIPEDKAPLRAITDVLQTAPNGPHLQDLTALVDMDEVLAGQAVEAMVYHWDGYTTENNYHVTISPVDGRLWMMPWGADQTWVDPWYGLYDGNGDLFTWCLDVPACRGAYNAQLRRVAQTAINLDLEARLDALLDFLVPNVPNDVRGAVDPGTFQDRVNATRQTIRNHPAEILAAVP